MSNAIALSRERRLATPDREALLAQFARCERRSRLVLGFELAVIAGAALWSAVTPSTLSLPAALLVAAVSAAGLFDWVVGLWLTPRMSLARMPADARWGPHTRATLQAAVERVKRRLGLSGERCEVWLTHDKELNAHALRMDLLPGMSAFRYINLNRSIVHLLDEDELDSVIGHELGHAFVHSPIASRCVLIHAALAAAIGVVLARLFADGDLWIAAPLIGIGVARWFGWSTSVAQSRVAEFLCDDVGARAAGSAAAISAQLKLALEAEARAELVLGVLRAKLAGVQAPMDELLETMERALPFGAVDRARASASMRADLARLSSESNRSSLGGFLRHAWGSDDVDTGELTQTVGRMTVVARLERARPEDISLALSPGPSREQAQAQWIHAIESQPRKVGFALSEELDDRDGTHPNASRRLLYLWRNRAAV